MTTASKSLFRAKAHKHKMALLEEQLKEAVIDAKVEGATWGQIAKALGTTRQAASEKYSKYVETKTVRKPKDKK